MKKYLLKEYGSWGVMTLSYLAGLVSAARTNMSAAAGFLALALLINAKQPITVGMRAAQGEKTIPYLIALLHAGSAALLLTPLYLQYEFRLLLPYALFPAAYLACLVLLGEHSIVTELSGFILLSLAALVAKAVAGSGLDGRLFLAVAVFFAAGVFRVRIQLKKELRYRIIMSVYLIGAFGLYAALGLRPVLLLPLADNLVFAASVYRVSLPATGWIEMVKGFLFLLLLVFFGSP